MCQDCYRLLYIGTADGSNPEEKLFIVMIIVNTIAPKWKNQCDTLPIIKFISLLQANIAKLILDL